MKIAISAFSGVEPILPDHNLPEGAASEALNARLDNSAIRPMYDSIVSAFTPVTLSDGPNNMYKASYAADDISWMVWSEASDNSIVQVLETRYGTIDAYEVPPQPDPVDPTDGSLNVALKGKPLIGDSDTGYYSIGNGVYTSSQWNPNPTSDHTFTYTSPEAEVLSSHTTPVTYLWTFVSGASEMVMSDASTATPTFVAIVPAPFPLTEIDGTSSYSSKSAVLNCTATDNLGATGVREVRVTFTQEFRKETP